jgi:arginase family enzyme
MHEDAIAAGNLVVTIGDVRANGIDHAIGRALDHVAHCDALVVDCDIDVIDRSQFPAAPGARPGEWLSTISSSRCAGLQPTRAFGSSTSPNGPAARSTELSALTAARWVAECLAGYEMR